MSLSTGKYVFLSWSKYIFLLHNQVHLSSPQSSTSYSPQAIKYVFLIIINFFGCLRILWRVRGWDFVLCTDFLLSPFAIRNCCPNLLLEYTSTVRHSFSTGKYTTFPSSYCIFLSTCNEARLFFTSNNYFGCQFYGVYEGGIFFKIL